MHLLASSVVRTPKLSRTREADPTALVVGAPPNTWRAPTNQLGFEGAPLAGTAQPVSILLNTRGKQQQ